MIAGACGEFKQHKTTSTRPSLGLRSMARIDWLLKKGKAGDHLMRKPRKGLPAEVVT